MFTPFTAHVPDAVLHDLRLRLAETRWPDQLPGTGWDLGTDVASAERVLADARAGLPAADALRALAVLGLSPAERSDVLRSVEDLAHRRLPQARPRSGSRHRRWCR